MSSELTLTVHGMTCEGCEASIRRAVGRVDGVAEVSADHVAERVVVRPADIDEDAVRAAIEDAGFEVAGRA